MQPNIAGSRPAVSQASTLFRRIGRALFWFVLLLYGIVTLYPFVWLVTSAFKTNEDFYNRPFGLPEVWKWENFTVAWESSNLGNAFNNSMIVSIGSLVLTLFISALASFVLARFSFRWKGIMLAFLLSAC